MPHTPINSIKHARILLSPLNWGLGHVSRTVPIIQALIKNQNEVIICCDENQESFYRHFFPSLWYVPHEGYPFQFKGNGRWTKDILQNLRSLNSFLAKEKDRVDELVEKFDPDLLISDQRFGFKSQNVKSIIISHQLKLPVAKWSFIAQLWNKKLLTSFQEIWIPDASNHNISGKLSTGNYKNTHFIGACSRFCKASIKKVEAEKENYHYLGIVSGPKPYNQQLLKLLVEKLKNSQQKSAIIVPEDLYDEQFNSAHLTVIKNPVHQSFCDLIVNSKVIISRSGYSTLMDLHATNKEGILIPTPGQTEQIYLSQLHKDHKNWRFRTEKEFLEMAL